MRGHTFDAVIYDLYPLVAVLEIRAWQTHLGDDETVVLEVTEADPVVKGQTAASSYKPAVLSNGVKTMVPPFVTTGEKIVVKTDDASYVERAKG